MSDDEANYDVPSNEDRYKVKWSRNKDEKKRASVNQWVTWKQSRSFKKSLTSRIEKWRTPDIIKISPFLTWWFFAFQVNWESESENSKEMKCWKWGNKHEEWNSENPMKIDEELTKLKRNIGIAIERFRAICIFLNIKQAWKMKQRRFDENWWKIDEAEAKRCTIERFRRPASLCMY